MGQMDAKHRPELHTDRRGGNEPLGRGGSHWVPTSYRRTSRDSPSQNTKVGAQAEGNNKKAHLTTRQSQPRKARESTQVLERKALASQERTTQIHVDTNSVALGLGRAENAASMTRSGRPQLRDRAISAGGCGCPEWALA